MYWLTRNDTNNRLVSSMMSRGEFEECKRYLHLCDNDHLDKNNKFFKTDLCSILLTNNVWKTTYQCKMSASMSPWFHIWENVKPSGILMASPSSLAIKCGLQTNPWDTASNFVYILEKMPLLRSMEILVMGRAPQCGSLAKDVITSLWIQLSRRDG